MKGGILWRQKKFRKKVAQCRKKIEKGDSLVPSSFVGYLEKVKNERGTLCTKFALAGLGALGGFRIVSKKWTDQCEDCSLKKKTVTAIVGHFSLKGKAPTKKNILTKNLSKKKTKYPVSRIVPKTLRSEPIGVFLTSILLRTVKIRKKMKEDPSETIKSLRKRSLSRNYM